MHSAQLALSSRRTLVSSRSIVRNTPAVGEVTKAGAGRALVVSGFVLLATALVAYLVSALTARGGAEWLLAPAALLGALAVRAGETVCAALVKRVRG